MAKLEEIIAGARVSGITPSGGVVIRAVHWHGNSVLSVTYRTDEGLVGETMLYRDNETDLTIESARPWTFDADPDDVRLVSEAYRIGLASLFDPYLAVRTSAIQPLPHQISAVYQSMLPRMPLRYVLADDPGAGKTVMTGLLIKEMMTRGDLKRCLVVCPGNLAEQWQDELFLKFGIRFTILTNDLLESSVTGNAFLENDLCIARLDKLSRNDDVRDKLSRSAWDLVVCDEAHKMSATVFGGEVKYTRRFLLGRLLGEITENLLLLTATPHNGKPKDFQLFMSLIDEDRFAGTHGKAITPSDVSDVMRRLVKEELLTFEGKPLFPERRAYTVNYSLSPAEAELYAAVTDYVKTEFNRADRLDNKRKNSVGFALTMLQRRLASSPEAIYQSLRRRRERLESRLIEAKRASRVVVSWSATNGFDPSDEEFDEDDYTSEEFEGLEDDVTDTATASATIPELEAEIAILKGLEATANAVRTSGEDHKWDELSKLLQDNGNMFGADGRREKLIIFTEHKDTLRYLAGKIRSLLGDNEAVITIQGGMTRDARRAAEESFKQDKRVRILVATDAAGEGINLQRAHLMVNYDLPWNPNRIEQRFGRIHRIGQTEVCHLWNLVSKETREGEVFERLFTKLEEERKALGGKVFDVLGRLTFDDRPLRDLLLEAIRYGDDPKIKERLNTVVDHSLDQEALRKVLEEYALTDDLMDVHTVSSIKEDMERAEARKLEPHFIESFFLAAMARLGGSVKQREGGRYEVTNVPYAVRNKGAQIGAAAPVLQRYERICFTRELRTLQGEPEAELVCPGHPLLDSIVALLIERDSAVLKKGTVFVDDNDFGIDPRLLLYVEDSVQDGTVLPNGRRRTISKEMRFVEVGADGSATPAGYAPYLDYRAPRDSERAIAARVAAKGWGSPDIEADATDFAATSIIPGHIGEVRRHREAQVDKIQKAVRERLTAEIQYWDSRAWALKEKESAGRRNARLNSENASKRADELAERLRRREDQLTQERKVSATPPVIMGGALVIPIGLIWKEAGSATATTEKVNNPAVEAAGMRAVAKIECELGNKPKDVSAAKCGYDIESEVPESSRVGGQALRFIEVKGHSPESGMITVTKNEILCALNNPERFVLAAVEVDGNITRTTYFKHPFEKAPDFSASGVIYEIDDLRRNSEVLLEREDSWQ